MTGDGDERVDDAAHDRAAVEAGCRHGLRRRLRGQPRGRPTRQHTLDDAQVLDLLALGACGKPCASLPLHLLVQRERVRHVAYQIVTVVGAHHSSGISPRNSRTPSRAHGARPVDTYLIYSLMTFAWPKPDGFPRWAVCEDALPGAPARWMLPSGGQQHDLAQPNHSPLERLARCVRTRQAFDGRELLVVVPQFRTAYDQPAIADLQTLQALPVTPPYLIVQELLILRRRILEGPQGFLPSGRGGRCPDVECTDASRPGRGSPRRAGDRRARR